VPGDNEKATKSKGKGKLIIILLILLVVLVGGGAVWYFVFRESPDDFAPVKNNTYYDDEDDDADSDNDNNNNGNNNNNNNNNNYNNNRYVYPPGTKFERVSYNDIIVNLAGGGGSSYLRVSLTFEYPASVKKLPEEITEKEPQIKDSILACLRSKTREDVAKTEELKNGLLRDVNRNLAYGDFTEVYFTDFLVQ